MVVINWIKRNKITTILLLVIIFLFAILLDWKNKSPVIPAMLQPFTSEALPMMDNASGGIAKSMPQRDIGIAPIPPVQNDYAPTIQTNRLVISESSMSFVVSKVRETSDKIIDYVVQNGGYMVSVSLSNPEDAPFGTVVVRVPAKNFKDILSYFRTLAVKVSSENIFGTDVTNEYVDIQARLATLNLTKEKFESILKQATDVNDILSVQREITTLQSQIDEFKGRQQYLEKNAELAKVTIYLSTDELSLPYAPTEKFRPNVIFKLAVRSLLQHIQKGGELFIWIIVYSVIWIPLLTIGIIAYKWKQRMK